MKTVAIYTLGCKVNQYESDAIGELFKNEGYTITSFDRIADVYVINTCTVTGVSDQKSRRAIRKAKNMNKNATVIVVGCYAQASPKEVQSIDGVDIIIGTSNRNKIIDYLKRWQSVTINAVNTADTGEYNEFEEMTIHGAIKKTRAFVKIQDGCEQYCSYCIIPYVRGGIKSRSLKNIVCEVERLTAVGFKEIVLTGINIGDYNGKQSRTDTTTGIGLTDVIKAVCQVEGVERIRLGSLECTAVTDEFLDCVSSIDKLCPHYHIPLQSGCDKTLAHMNRKYTTQFYYDTIQKVRKHYRKFGTQHVGIYTDIIVGFPGETDNDFQSAAKFVENLEFSGGHVFKYSPRNGTPAANFTCQIESGIKEQRSKRIIEILNDSEHTFKQKLVGSSCSVLLEQNSEICEGFTPNYVKVRIQQPPELKRQINAFGLGEIVPVLIQSVDCDNIVYGCLDCANNKEDVKE